MPKVLLVYPPSRTQRHGTCPMGLLMLAAALEYSGCEVDLLDANAECRSLTSEDILAEAAVLKPDVISISLVTPIIKEAYRLSAMLDSAGFKLLAGGPHATLLPAEPLEHGFKAVVVGEGEATIYEAVQAVMGVLPMAEVKGLSYLDADKRQHLTKARPLVENLDELPNPALHLIEPSHYGSSNNTVLYGNIFSSRGCPARCSYCAGQLFGKGFRFRSAEHVVQEIGDINRRFGTSHFYFVDDAMSMDKERMAKICAGIRALGIELTWSMMTRIDAVDDSLLKMVSLAGCVQIDYGVESGCPETLKKIKKPHTVEMVRRIIPLTAKYGIKPFVFFIVGFPWESRDSIHATRQLMEDIAPYVDNFHPAIASILIPFPGTAIYEEHKARYGFENWWLSDDRSYDAPQLQTHPYYQTILFRNGAVLDADFFHYQEDVRREIFKFFDFMYRHNLKKRRFLPRVLSNLLFSASQRLSSVSPILEKWLVGYPVSRYAVSQRKVKGAD